MQLIATIYPHFYTYKQAIFALDRLSRSNTANQGFFAATAAVFLQKTFSTRAHPMPLKKPVPPLLSKLSGFGKTEISSDAVAYTAACSPTPADGRASLRKA